MNTDTEPRLGYNEAHTMLRRLAVALSSQELARYNRHLKLNGFGLEAQQRLKATSVLLIGAGGLGCPIGMYLAAAGVGKIGVVDYDTIEVTNLQRQIAHKSADQGLPKADSLIAAMKALNPLPEYVPHHLRLAEDNIRRLISGYDLIIDGTDNYPTRYLVADTCFLENKPLVYGAIHQFDAQLSLFVPNDGPCYRCLFPSPPDPESTPSCSEAGVLGVLPGTVGVMMATEAIKFITGVGQTLQGKLALYNALDQTLRHIGLGPDPSCPLCGENPTITEPEEIQFACEVLEPVPRVSLQKAKTMIEAGAAILDVRDDLEWQTCHLEGAVHLPLPQLEAGKMSRFNPKQPMVVYCYTGIRSQKAVARLQEWGFEESVSMDGGIKGWALEIDPEMVRY